MATQFFTGVPDSVSPGWNMFSPTGGFFAPAATRVSASSTKVVYANPNGTMTVLTGSGIAFGSGGAPTAGTITAIEVFNNAQTAILTAFTGLSTPLIDVWNAWFSGADSGGLKVVEVLLAGNDLLRGGARDDNMYGFAGDDLILAGAGDDYVEPGQGSDAIDGEEGHDILSYATDYNGAILSGVTLTLGWNSAVDPWGFTDTYKDVAGFRGTRLADVVTGTEGHNTFAGLGGNDVFHGGAGIDEVWYHLDGGYGGKLGVTVRLDAGTATDGFGNTDTLTSIEDATGSAFADSITGSAVANTLSGLDGNDVLNGLGGADLLLGGAGTDVINGGDGDDSIQGEQGGDYLYGGAGTDTINGGDGDDSIRGEQGSDYLYGGAGINVITGGDGDDSIQGGQQADYLEGGAGIDFMVGRAGIDYLWGDSGNDYLDGGADTDVAYGGAGLDYLWGEAGRDYLDGGSETDVLYGGAGIDSMWGEGGNDYIAGGTETDEAFGGQGVDSLWGEQGDDYLYGGTEGDVLYGDDGSDTLWGEEGDDYLYGGTGRDLFYHRGNVDGYDTILDFNLAELDTLVLSGYTSFEQVQAAAYQSGSYAVIPTGSSAIYLANVQVTDLTAAHVYFM